MAVTSSPTDKYAFLFTGPTAIPNYIVDIENVYETLTQYYRYPPGHIMVVLGSSSATPSVPGASVTNITNAAELETALNDFAAMASGVNKTALLYFTGGGCNSAGAALVINGGADCTSAVTVSPAWLTTRLNALTGGRHVNVVMQQSYAGGFDTALTGSTLTQWSFAHACGAG